MKQTKLMSWVETCLNTGIGFAIAIATQILVFPLFGYDPPLSTNFKIALIFTVVSIVRGYVLRRLFEYFHIRVPMSPALVAIAAERRRQQDVEGYDLDHDDKHERGELAAAGACYALLPAKSHGFICRGGLSDYDAMPPEWPWAPSWWKPDDDRRNLVRAGALILAELERLLRNRKRR